MERTISHAQAKPATRNPKLFSCQRCNTCCTSFGVCITIADIKRIKEELKKDPLDFVDTVDDYSPRFRTEPAVMIEGKPKILVLKHDTRRVCTFFDADAKGCSIHPSRPFLCRTYPFTLKEGKLSDVENRACAVYWYPQGSEKKQYESDLQVYGTQIEEYKKLVAIWNRKNPKGTLKEFLAWALSV